MLHILVDTSTWLDLSKRRDGQRWIVALRLLAHKGQVELLVPQLVVEEFERNRDRIEASMTASVAQRFKLIKQDLDQLGGTDSEHALQVIEGLAPGPTHRRHDNPQLQRSAGAVASGQSG